MQPKPNSKAAAFPFTAKAVEALPVPPGRGDVFKFFDKKQDCLLCLVRGTGSRDYYFVKTYQTKKRNLKLGSTATMTPDDARARVRAILAEMDAGTWQAPTEAKAARIVREAIGKGHRVTLAEVSRDYVAFKDLRPASVRLIDEAVRLHLAPLANKPLIAVTRADVLELVANMRDAGHSDANTKRVVATLKSHWNFARAAYRGDNDAAIFGENPASAIRDAGVKLKVQRRSTLIHKPDLGVWWNAVDAFPSAPRTRAPRAGNEAVAHVTAALAKMLLLTGWRIKEMACLEWHQIRLDAGLVSVNKQVRKTGEGDYMPISEEAVRVLRELKEARYSARFVFPSGDSESGYLTNANSALKFASAAIGYKIGAHDLRRTFLTITEALGFSMLTAKRLAGHKSQESDVTAGYIISYDDTLKKCADALADFIVSEAKRAKGRKAA